MSSLRTVDNRAGLLDISQLFEGEGIAENILCQGLPPFLIVSCDSYPVVYAEAGMSPLHKFIDEIIVYLPLLF